MLCWWLPLASASESLHIEPRLVAGETVHYRQQLQISVHGDLPPSRLDAQQHVAVEVEHTTDDGSHQVRTSTRTIAALRQVGGEAPVPGTAPEHATTWLVDPSGTWRVAQRSGDQDPLHNTLGSLTPTPHAFHPPSHPIEVGHAWTVPVDLTLTALDTELQLTGQSSWRFQDWDVIDGVRCARLVEATTLKGTSRTEPLEGPPHLTGVSSTRRSEVCWDPAAQVVHWQRSESRIALHDGSGDTRLRMELRQLTGRVPPPPSGAPSGTANTTRTWPR